MVIVSGTVPLILTMRLNFIYLRHDNIDNVDVSANISANHLSMWYVKQHDKSATY